MVGSPRRDEVWLINLDPSKGAEIRKTRPCCVVSPDEMNEHLLTVLIAPMTTTLRSYPTRVTVKFQGKTGQVALDQIRAVTKERLVRKLGRITEATAAAASTALVQMFSRV